MPWRIPEAEIERVKRETDLVALVQSRGIELKKHGTKDFIGRCPFHDDRKTPNFGTTHQFNCLKSGCCGRHAGWILLHNLAYGHRSSIWRS